MISPTLSFSRIRTIPLIPVSVLGAFFAHAGFRVLAVGIFATMLSQPLVAVAEPSLAAYQGDWRQTESTEAEADRISSIDSAIDELTWVVRKMAGGVLRSSTKPPSEVHFVWDGSALHQRVNGSNGAFSRPVVLGADPVEAVDERGDAFTSSWDMGDEGLALSWEQHQAYGTNIYRLADGGQTLEIEHTINVTALSGVEPIVYRSRFKRGSLPVSASLPSSSSRTAPPSVSAGPAQKSAP